MLFSEAETIVNEYASNLLAQPGIVAVGVGNKDDAAIDTSDSFCVKVFVEKKIPEFKLNEMNRQSVAHLMLSAVDSDKVPFFGINDDVTEYIDIVEAGSSFAPLNGLRVPRSQIGLHGGTVPQINLQKRFVAPRSGIGITNPRNYPDFLDVGTLGFFVKDDQENLYIVSNNHVIADMNKGKIGDIIVQPGTLDLTSDEINFKKTRADIEKSFGIASLSAWVELRYKTNENIPLNRVDAAIARTIPDLDHSAVGRVGLAGRIAGIAPELTADANGNLVGDATVYKFGRTTGLTEGVIISAATRTAVKYRDGVAEFAGQLVVRPKDDNVGPFSSSGDSGSAVLNSHNQLVGLMFGGSTAQTLVNPIGDVLIGLTAALKVPYLRLV